MLRHRRSRRPESEDRFLALRPDQNRAFGARCGQTKIELLEPTSPESTIAAFIEKNNGKGGMHHIAFAVENLEGHLEEAKELGIRLIDQAPRKGAEGLSIAFLHPKSTCGVLTELCEDKNK